MKVNDDLIFARHRKKFHFITCLCTNQRFENHKSKQQFLGKKIKKRRQKKINKCSFVNVGLNVGLVKKGLNDLQHHHYVSNVFRQTCGPDHLLFKKLQESFLFLRAS